MKSLTEISVADLELIRDTLISARGALEAFDIYQSSMYGLSQIRYSPLTQSIAEASERADNALKDHLLQQHDEDRVYDDEPDDEDPEESSSDAETLAFVNSQLTKRGVPLAQRQETLSRLASGEITLEQITVYEPINDESRTNE